MPAHGPTGSPLAIALFNDTGDNAHLGCLAVSEAHRHMLRRAGAHVRHAYFCCEWHPLGAGGVAEGIDAALANDVLRGSFDDVDAVVVNGEGTVHHGYGRHLIAILGAAQRLGIPTFLVNAVLQECDDAREVLSALDDCTVRDGCSSRYLETLGVRHRLVPDSFFEAPFLGAPIHYFAGTLVVTDCHPDKAAEFAPALAGLRTEWQGPVADYALEAPERVADWRHALSDFAAADVIVTGRHHGACLALRAGVPFVTLPSNTWKLEGLLQLLDGYPADAADTARPLIERVAAARAHRRWFQDASARWRAMLPLTTFQGLAGTTRRSCVAVAAPAIDQRTLRAVRRTAVPGGRILHAGCGRGPILSALVRDGYDAVGVDVAAATVALGAALHDRAFRGTPGSLPFPARSFATTIVSAGWLDALDDDDLDRALREIARVTDDTVIVETSGRPLRTEWPLQRVRTQPWWESRLRAAGFRSHPLGQRATDMPPRQAIAECLLMQTVREGDAQADARAHDGRSSGDPPDHARLARYEWACSWIKPGDLVVDAACGTGDGTALLWDETEASRVVAIDRDHDAIAFAAAHVSRGRAGVAFLPADDRPWASWADNSIDCIVAFALPDLAAHDALGEVQRVLKPGGRLLCAAPHDAGRLIAQSPSSLLVDEVFVQAAGSAADHEVRHPKRVERYDQPGLDDESSVWLISAMKDPLSGADVPYVEQVFPADDGHAHDAIAFARDYVNPWAVHALVMGSYRIRSARLLRDVSARWLGASPAGSADAGAALCILAYRELEERDRSRTADLMADIRAYCDGPARNPQVRRWQISLRFVTGLLQMRQGDLDGAEHTFRECAREDASAFTPHLETKTTEAAWLAGRLALERGDVERAEIEWRHAFEILERVKSAPVGAWLITPSRPAAFEAGDGLREIAIAVDNAARCANGLRYLAERRSGRRIALGRYDRNFQRNTADLLDEVHRRGGAIESLETALQSKDREMHVLRHESQRTVEKLRGEQRRVEGQLRQMSAERAVLLKRAFAARHRHRVGIFGTGAGGIKVWQALSGIDEADVCWFADNNPVMQGRTLLWSDVISPAAIRSRSFDAIVIASVSRNPIRQQLRDLGVGGAQILAPEMAASTDRVRIELLALLGSLAPAARVS